MNRVLIGMVCLGAWLAAEGSVALVPMPRNVKETGGAFVARADNVSELPVSRIKDAALPREGYSLRVTEREIVIRHADEAGAFYAQKTLEQLAVPVTTRAATKKTGTLAVPCVEIDDAPAYAYRGVMIDDARHFMGKETIKKELDLMAAHKLNVFHWHLVDDQGWRIEIKKHPELVEYGAVRPCSVVMGGTPRWEKGAPRYESIRYDFNTEKYGPFFYTQDDIREVVAYAAARHITVVPEIEMPGHVRALLAARPDLGCRGGKLARVPRVLWSIEPDVLCAGNDDVLAYLKDIFDEVCALFPSAYVHIGGDECPKLRWQECAKCQARKQALGLKDERGLQAWLTKEIVEYLAQKGRRVIGWDEVLHGDVPQNVIGMSWRMSAKGGAGGDFVSAADAMARGFDMVMTPSRLCYYSYPQSLAEDPYPYYSAGGGLSLAQAYSFDPAANIPTELRRHVLGGQASIWSEMTFNVFDLEWKMWPRTCAMAEVLWTAPETRDFSAFHKRMVTHRRRLIAQHVNCAPLE